MLINTIFLSADTDIIFFISADTDITYTDIKNFLKTHKCNLNFIFKLMLIISAKLHSFLQKTVSAETDNVFSLLVKPIYRTIPIYWPIPILYRSYPGHNILQKLIILLLPTYFNYNLQLQA